MQNLTIEKKDKDALSITAQVLSALNEASWNALKSQFYNQNKLVAQVETQYGSAEDAETAAGISRIRSSIYSGKYIAKNKIISLLSKNLQSSELLIMTV